MLDLLKKILPILFIVNFAGLLAVSIVLSRLDEATGSIMAFIGAVIILFIESYREQINGK